MVVHVLKLLEEDLLSWEDDPVLPVEIRPVRDVPHCPAGASANAACQNGGVIPAGYATDISPDVDFSDGTAAPVADVNREEEPGPVPLGLVIMTWAMSAVSAAASWPACCRFVSRCSR